MKSFFDEENRMEKISKIGDPLEILNSIINWEMFRVILKKHIVRKESNKGGRPPFDIVMMFKILVLERLYNMSDDQAEFQINDRRSFMRFLGLESYDTVPDAKTIWKFRDDLSKTDSLPVRKDKPILSILRHCCQIRNGNMNGVRSMNNGAFFTP